MLEQANSYASAGAALQPVPKQAILALALTTVKADAATMEDCVVHISKSLQAGQLVEYMAEAAENAVLASADGKTVLSGECT